MIPARTARMIPLLMVVCFLTLPAQAQYSGGSGTADDPYQIATAEDLMLLGETPEDYDKHFILTADIDLDPNLPGRKVFDRAVIAPDTINSHNLFQGIPFTGVFNGSEHTVSHLTISGRVDYLGLFGQLGSEAEISSVGLVDANVVGTGSNIGLLVGQNNGSVSNCYGIGSVAGEGSVGGFVGVNDGSVSYCYSTGTVSGEWSVGGLVGRNKGDATITVSYSTVSATGDRKVGGLVGSSYGRITMSYSTGTVTGEGWSLGGLVGDNEGRITMTYSTGVVTGNDCVGGLVGSSYGRITMSYSTGTVTGNNDVGGLVGISEGDSIASLSFWDMETSGQPTSDGGTGLTTPEMQDINTYLSAGWDFADEVLNGTCDYWQMSPGEYPRLQYHADNSPVMPEGLGTAEQPYLIRDARDLGTVWFKPTAHYRLETSLDLSGTTWSMAVVPWFDGTFEGNGHVISNLHTQGGGLLGLFGQTGPEAKISNLGLEAVDISGGGGGLVAGNWGTIRSCYSTGSVTGGGGLVAGNWGTITSCYSTASVTGGGGLVGANYGSVTMSYSMGSVTGEGRGVGGLVGGNLGIIMSCYSTGAVSGDRCVGGLVGWNDDSSIISSYSTGSVSGDRCVGGLVGCNGDSSIISSYSTGSVSGDRNVGGLVGSNVGSIKSSYSTGAVTGNDEVGGLVGYTPEGSITSSFWDMETSGQATSDGGTGATTAEMQSAGTFLAAGWDFIDETQNGSDDIWWILEGQDYPRLWWELMDDRPPVTELAISSPIPDERFVIGEEVHFTVVVASQVDLDGLQLTWTSSRDGDLGTGRELTLDHLSAGSHIIQVCGYGLCASISVRIYEDLWELYQAPPAEGEIARIMDDFSFNLIDGAGRDERWAAYEPVFDQDSTDPSFLVAISKIDILRHQRFSTPAPFAKGQTLYDHLRTHVKTINLKLDCSYNTAGGDRVNLNRNFSVWDGRTSGTPSNWGACKIPFANHRLFPYTNPLYLLMHEGRHCEPDDPGHKTCDGRPKDEMLEDGSGYAQATLYLMWVYKYGLYDPPFIRSEAGSTAASFLDRFFCTAPTHSDPNVQAIIDELLTKPGVDVPGPQAKTTAEMQAASPFVEAGWDFIDETDNGTDDVCWILEGQDYPRLWWEATSNGVTDFKE